MCRAEENKEEKWDNCNGIINKIYFKKLLLLAVVVSYTALLFHPPNCSTFLFTLFILCISVPWRIKGEINVYAERETGWAEWYSGEGLYQIVGMTSWTLNGGDI